MFLYNVDFVFVNVYLNVRFQARVLKFHVISQGLIIYLFFYEGSNII